MIARTDAKRGPPSAAGSLAPVADERGQQPRLSMLAALFGPSRQLGGGTEWLSFFRIIEEMGWSIERGNSEETTFRSALPLKGDVGIDKG